MFLAVLRIRDVYPESSFQFSPSRTRQVAGEHGLSVQFARTDPRKYSFAVRTVENWNKLPEDVKTSRNGEEFKNKLKKLSRNHRRGDPVKVTDNAEK
jgi:hypothetical protein